jgi:CheY-like chemotaxis protein
MFHKYRVMAATEHIAPVAFIFLSPGFRGPPVPKSILIIEDDEIARIGLSTVLQMDGYNTVAAPDGKEALDRLQSGLQPALILLDMILPGLDGWKFCAHLKNNQGIAAPFVIMTGVGVASEEWAKSLGAVGLLRKPMDVERLSEIVRRFVPTEGQVEHVRAKDTRQLLRERRSGVRFPSQLAALVRTGGEKGGEWPGWVRDMSVTGVGLVLGHRFAPGTVLAVQFLREPGGLPSFRVQAEVLRVVAESCGYLHGCLFTPALSNDELASLVQ